MLTPKDIERCERTDEHGHHTHGTKFCPGVIVGPEAPNFEGHDDRECGEHRTVGSHRAWCYDCHEWCYPLAPCKGCELSILRAKIERLETA